MREVRVTHEYSLPPEEVFRRIADHERFLSGKGLACRVVVPGDRERDGVNAIREVRAGGTFFRERITAFDPPRRLAYRIETLRQFGLPLGFHHEGGEMRIEPTGSGARVIWISRFDVRLPLIGDKLCRHFAKVISRKFASLLRQADPAA